MQLGMSRGALAALAAVMIGALSAPLAPAVAQDPGVTYDDSPGGSEYQVPLSSARGDKGSTGSGKGSGAAKGSSGSSGSNDSTPSSSGAQDAPTSTTGSGLFGSDIPDTEAPAAKPSASATAAAAKRKAARERKRVRARKAKRERAAAAAAATTTTTTSPPAATASADRATFVSGTKADEPGVSSTVLVLVIAAIAAAVIGLVVFLGRRRSMDPATD